MHNKVLRNTLLQVLASVTPRAGHLAVVTALSVPLIFAQIDAGRFVGTVTDASGASVPNASISVVNEKTGQERKVTADGSGAFVVPNLASSTYKISIQTPGFAEWKATGVPISVGQERTLNVNLQPASVTTEVLVSGGELTLVDTSSASIGANCPT